MNNIETLAITLSSQSISEKVLNDCLEQFFEFSTNTENISKEPARFAKVFVLLLKGYTKHYNNNLEKLSIGTTNKLHSGFMNIHNIALQNMSVDDSSNLKVIFLLKLLREDESTNPDKLDKLRKCVDSIMDVLPEIEIVFNIKDNEGKYYFPLSQVIQHIIGNYYKSSNETIDIYDVRILQLAVRLFQKDTDIQGILTKLEKDFNMRFIHFLSGKCRIVDSNDSLNYRKNKTMIFINKEKHSVLVRNDDKNYFSGENHIDTERDCEGNPIGYWIETPPRKGKFTSFNEIIKKEAYRKILLKLLFDEKKQNIFLEDSLFETVKGEIISVNPFCFNDKYIIYPTKSGYKTMGELEEDEPEYNLFSIKKPESDNPYDRITFGLCWFLLRQKAITTEMLFAKRTNDDWYQNQIIENWIDNPQITGEDIKHLMNRIAKELSECCDTEKVKKQDIKSQCFLPLDGRIVHTLCSKIIGKDSASYQIMHATESEFNSSEITISGKTVINIKNIEIIDESFEWSTITHFNPIWIIQGQQPDKYYIANQYLLSGAYKIQDIQKNCLPYNTFKDDGKELFSKLETAMELFAGGFKDSSITKELYCLECLEEQIYLRILYNLVWLKINSKSQIDVYRTILNAHRFIKFKQTVNDIKNIINKIEQGTLVIPKDLLQADSVLAAANNNYYLNTAKRNKYNMFCNEISEKGGIYQIHNITINEIVFITDNSLKGNATKRALEKLFNNNSTYLKDTKGNKITIPDIMKKNSIKKLNIVCIFGTMEAQTVIERFLETKQIQCEVQVKEEILDCKTNEETIQQALTLFPDSELNQKDSFYMVFREFSMPKKCIFPSVMIDDPQKAICLFIRKKEL